MDHERRRSPRYPLIADAEIVALRSNVQLSAKTSDVSLLGCFMNAARSNHSVTLLRFHRRSRMLSSDTL